MNKENKEIRKLIEQNNLYYWEIAKHIGISASTFTVWLRTPLSKTKEKIIFNSIKELKEVK